MTTSGGGSLLDLLPSNNLVANNHLTQVYLSGKWVVGLGGLGDRFSHNLVHDSPGQTVAPGGGRRHDSVPALRAHCFPS